MGLSLGDITRAGRSLARSMLNPAGSLVGQGLEASTAAISELTPELPPPPPPLDMSPIIAALRGTPSPTIDTARLRLEQSDATRRKRGRRASILTGPEGVGSSPVGQRTLIGT